MKVLNFVKKYWMEILGITLTGAGYFIEAKMADKNSALFEASKEQIKNEIIEELKKGE